MYRSLLVPLDGSTFGEQALPFALSIARRAGAAVQLVHVHVPLASLYFESMPTFDSALDARTREQENAYLETMVKHLAGISTVPVTAKLLEGPVADAVHEHALATSTDLVVLTTHGRGRLSRFWLGSVADELVRRLPMPLFLLRPQETPPALATEPVLRQMLIPLDGSAFAEQILAPATVLGRLMQVEYTLLRVVQPAMLVGYDPSGFGLGGMATPSLEQAQREAATYLAGVAERLRGQSLQVQTCVTISPHPAVAILDAAREGKVGLIALETHGHRGLTRMVLGSIADKLLRGAVTPVLIHRPVTQSPVR
jgi:nucleotide-binding universal stress UspA family protein